MKDTPSDPRHNPEHAHLYATQDRLAGFLWGEIAGDPDLARDVSNDLKQILAGNEFPVDYSMNLYCVDILSPEEVVITHLFADDFGPESVEPARLLAALDEVAAQDRG